MQDQKELFIAMKDLLESNKFTDMLIEHDINNYFRREFLIRTINFLVATRDFDNLWYYLDNYKELFPNSYLEEYKNLSREEANKTIYRNYLIDGFLYHVTPNENLDNVLKNGILSLNDRCKTDMYRESMKVNTYYKKLVDRHNSSPYSRTIAEKLITEVGKEELTEARFKNVYFVS